MTAPDHRLTVIAAGGVLGLMLGLGFGHWQQQRTLAVVEARHQAERKAITEALAMLGTRLDGLQEALVQEQQTSHGEHQRLSVRVHELSAALDDLRVLTQPVVAQISDADIELAAPGGAQ